MWVREWLSENRRQQLVHYSTFLIRELRTEDVRWVFFSFLCLRFRFLHFCNQVSSSSTFLFVWWRWIVWLLLLLYCWWWCRTGAFRTLGFFGGIASQPLSVDRLTAQTPIKLLCRALHAVSDGNYNVTRRITTGRKPSRTRNAPWLNATKRLLACRENRDKTGQNAQQPWSNRNKTNIKRGRTWQNVKRPWDVVEYILLPVPLRSTSKFCYGLLRTVKFCCVRPVFTTAYYVSHAYRRSVPWLPWQFFWEFTNLSGQPRQKRLVTFAHRVPTRCLTVAWNWVAVVAGNLVLTQH